eukprot:6183160-Pleurochrysis_carterae.AAC.1
MEGDVLNLTVTVRLYTPRILSLVKKRVPTDLTLSLRYESAHRGARIWYRSMLYMSTRKHANTRWYTHRHAPTRAARVCTRARMKCAHALALARTYSLMHTRTRES